MYRYYSIMRPVGPGTFPRTKRVEDVVNFDRRQFVPEINREACGYIEYVDPITEKQAADYELVPQVGRYSNPAVKHIVQILMERDDISEQEAQRMVDDCRQQLLSEAVPPRRLRSGRGNLG